MEKGSRPMNSAFELQKDKGLREDEVFRPYKIVRLWDMLPFYAGQFLKVISHLKIFEDYVEARVGDDIGCIKLSPFPAEERKRFAVIPTALAAISLNVSNKHAQELANYINNNEEIEANHLKTLAFALRWSIIHELQERVTLMIPVNRARWYKMAGTFLGDDILRKFAKLKLTEDASEAGNCFALGRYTACVFHLMRVMESVVQEFGRKAKISLDVKNAYWDKILKQVKKLTEIKDTDDAKMKKKKNRYQSFYNRLDAVRVAWRNSTMHPKTTYTEDEAKEVMDAVRLFLQDFSTLPRL
jgi:hypothetical protein